MFLLFGYLKKLNIGLLKLKMKRVAIIISSNNPGKFLVDCLKSLKQTSYPYKIFLVNDSGEKLKIKISKDIEVINTSGNTGFSKAYNVGIRGALKWKPDYVLLLNDDTEVVDPNWLDLMIKVGESDKSIGVLGCKITYPDGKIQNIGGYIKGWQITKELGKKDEPFEVDHIMGSFMLIKKEVIESIGLLDEIFNPYLLEDTSYCLTAKLRGFRILSVPHVKIIHKKGKSVDRQANYKRMFIRFRNDIIFSNRYLTFKNKLFRIFIYLPLVAIFRKNKDEDELKIKNFRLRKEFLINLFLLFFSYFYTLPKLYIDMLLLKND